MQRLYSYEGKVSVQDMRTNATFVILWKIPQMVTSASSKEQALNNLKWRIKHTPLYNIQNYQKIVLDLGSLKEE